MRKLSDPEDTCLSKAQLKFVIFGFYENDAVVKAVEVCAKANDPEGMPCLRKVQDSPWRVLSFPRVEDSPWRVLNLFKTSDSPWRVLNFLRIMDSPWRVLNL